jgi:hypothetical protein
MAKDLFNWLSREKDKHKILSQGLDIIYHFFIIFFVVYVLIKVYRFVYPENSSSKKDDGISGIINKSLQKEKEEATSWFSSILQSLSFIISPIKTVVCNIWSFLCWLVTNPYRALMVSIMVLFFVGFYYFRKLYDYSHFLKKYSSYISGFFIVIGVLLTLGVFGLFSGDEAEVKIKTAPKGYPQNSSMLYKFCWSICNAISYYKELLIITIAILCSLFLLWFSFKHSSIIFLLISAITGIFLFVKLFKCHIIPYFKKKGDSTDAVKPDADKSDKETPDTDDPDAKETTEEEPETEPESSATKENSSKQSVWFRILMVFYKIYDSIRDFFVKIYNSFTLTNYYIRVLLLIEIIGILLYFIIPIAIKYIYTHNVSKQGGILDTQADLGIDNAIIENENLLNGLRNGLSIDWDEIFSKGLYKEHNDDKLEKYLLSLGYKKKEEQQNKLINKMLGRNMNIETAKTYIQVNAPLIIELKNKIAHQKTSRWQTKEARKEENNIGKTKILLEKPIYTDTQRTIGTYDDIGDSIGTFNYNYSISSWFFIHNEPPSLRHANTKFTSLLNYSGRPNVLFNIKTNTLRITMKNTMDQEKTIYETDKIRLQRWNNIITNVNSGKVDIFINGKLVSSTTNPVPFMSYDKITSGEDEGISGGVCNVTYYPAPLSLAKIKLLYKSLKWKTPPII